MNYQALKDRHRAERDELDDDPDGRFISLWIAFNAAYATEIDERFRLSEQETFRAFLAKLVDLERHYSRGCDASAAKPANCW